MKLNYDFRPTLVNEVRYISHRMKEQNFRQSIHKHRQDFYEIIFLDYGEIILTLDKKQIKLAPGECVFIPGGVKHSFIEKNRVHFSFMNIMFYGKIPESLLDVNISVYRKGYDLMKKLKLESVQKRQHSNELIACYLTEFIINLIRQVSSDIPASLPEAILLQSYQSEIVNRAISVIANEYHKPLNLKKVSLAVGVSESHLRALLKKETGESFNTILHKQRVATAKHLLYDSNFSLEKIANSVGYSSMSFFFKVFKRSTGMTPKTYASSLGGANA